MEEFSYVSKQEKLEIIEIEDTGKLRGDHRWFLVVRHHRIT